MKHYVVIFWWDNNEAGDVEILGVCHSLDDAKEIFKRYVNAEMPYVEEDGLEIYEHTDVMFSAGDERHYEKFYIQGVM